MAWLRSWIYGVFCRAGGTTLETLNVMEITTLEALRAALEKTGSGVAAIFKHSTRCPISAAAYREVTAYLEKAGPDAPPFYLVKVIESRPVSNEAAARLGVAHQSPHVILLSGGQPYWNASHGGITAAAISGAVDKLRH